MWNSGVAGRRCAAAGTPGGEQQAALALGEGGELGDHRQAEAVGVGGVDAADQCIDETLVDLVAEPHPDQRADRVRWVAGPWQQRFDGGAQLAGHAQQAARRQGGEVAGHAEQQAVGDAVQAAVPDEGARRRWRRELGAEADPLGQGGALGNPGEEGVGALVDGRAPGER